jgi:hypothetical protein
MELEDLIVDVDAICRERMKPLHARMEAMASELERVRKEAAALNAKAIKAAEVDRLVQEAEAHFEEQVREQTAIERKRANRYRQRAYKAEKQLKTLLEGELDPYDFLPEQPLPDEVL